MGWVESMGARLVAVGWFGLGCLGWVAWVGLLGLGWVAWVGLHGPGFEAWGPGWVAVGWVGLHGAELGCMRLG